VKRVVALSPESDNAGSWRESGLIALEMFEEAGIEVSLYFPGKPQTAISNPKASKIIAPKKPRRAH
jgi:hypothetical protein